MATSEVQVSGYDGKHNPTQLSCQTHRLRKQIVLHLINVVKAVKPTYQWEYGVRMHKKSWQTTVKTFNCGLALRSLPKVKKRHAAFCDTCVAPSALRIVCRASRPSPKSLWSLPPLFSFPPSSRRLIRNEGRSMAFAAAWPLR